MPTKTPRERFDEQFGDGSGRYLSDGTSLNDIMDFIETLLEEARQEGENRGVQKGREEMREKCLKCIQKSPRYEMMPTRVVEDTIRDSISSL